MKGWDAHVFQTDGEEEKYRGFFFDKAQAEAWVAKQAEGTYEVRGEGPARWRS